MLQSAVVLLQEISSSFERTTGHGPDVTARTPQILSLDIIATLMPTTLRIAFPWLSFIALTFCFPAQATAQEKQAEEPAALTLADLSGQKQSLEAHRGRIVVLNFWATWCVPCREEMPLLVKLRKEYAARGVEVIGASADEESSQPKIAPFLKELKIAFPIWVGVTTADMQRLDLGLALPATAILDRDGCIVFRILGPLEKESLRARLDWLLGDRTADTPPALLSTFGKHAGEGNHEGHEHGHEGEEDHQHGGAGLDSASTVPS